MANDVVIHVKAKDDASAVFGSIEQKAGGLGSAMGTALKAGALAGGAAIAGLGVSALKMAADFETGFAEVKTLLPQLSEEAFGKLQKDIIGVSKEFGIATDKSIPALYQAISAGVPPDNVVEFMGIAAKASIGGVTDLETAVDGITSVVNAYGSEVIDAQKASDIMFTAVKAGKTDFGQLSASLFNVIPTAASLGVSFEDVAAQLATITSQGTPTSVATTQIRAAMVEAQKGGSNLDKALRELHGVGFADLIQSGKTMPQVFQELRMSMPEQDFKNLFGSVEAMNAVLGVTGDNFDTFSGNMDAAANSAGATEEAAAKIADTFNFKLNKFVNEAKITLMELGLVALPILTSALETVIPWLETNIPKAAEEMRKVFEDIKPTLEDLAHAFVTGLTTIQQALTPVVEYILDHKELLIAAITAIGVAIVVAFGPGALAIAAIVGLITAIGLIVENWDVLKAKMKEVGIDADELAAYFNEEFVPVLENLMAAIMAVVQLVIDNWPMIEKVITPVMEQIALVVETHVKTIIAFFDIIIQLLQGDFSGAWEAAKELVNIQMELIKGSVGNLVDFVQGLVPLLLAAGKAAMQGLFDGLSALWTDVIAPWLASLPAKAVQAIGNIYGAHVNVGENVIRGLWDGMNNLRGWIINKIGGLAGDIVKAYMDPLGILSPSRVMADEVGRPIMEGIAQGMNEGLVDIVMAGNNAADALLQVMTLHAQGFATNEQLLAAFKAAGEAAAAAYSGGFDDTPHGWGPIGGTPPTGGGVPVIFTPTPIKSAPTLGSVLSNAEQKLLKAILGSEWNPKTMMGSIDFAVRAANVLGAEQFFASMQNILSSMGGGGFSGHINVENFLGDLRKHGLLFDSGGWLPTGVSLAVNNTGRPERILGPNEGMGNTYVYAPTFSSASGPEAERFIDWVVAGVRRKSQGAWA